MKTANLKEMGEGSTIYLTGGFKIIYYFKTFFISNL